MTNEFRDDIEDEFGPHNMEACGRTDGKNVRKGLKYCHPDKPFQEYNGVKHDNILLHPPYSDAQSHLDHALSLHASDKTIGTEVNNLHNQNVYEWAPLKKGYKPTKSRAVFDIKWDKLTGLVEKFKCRIVACGYSQRAGIDFSETYASTPKLSTMRYFLHQVASHRMKTAEWDITAAYLHSEVKIIRTNCLTLTLTLTLTLILTLTLTLTLSVMEYLLVWSALQVQVENGREKWSMLHLRCPA